MTTQTNTLPTPIRLIEDGACLMDQTGTRLAMVWDGTAELMRREYTPAELRAVADWLEGRR